MLDLKDHSHYILGFVSALPLSTIEFMHTIDGTVM
jgi:hypothetical protein